MNSKELFDLDKVGRELMRLAAALEANNEELRNVKAELSELKERTRSLEENQAKLKDAAHKAFNAASKLNETVRHLQCLEPDTDPDCPTALSDPPAHRQSLQSISDIEEYSSVTAAAVGAATKAAIDVVKAHRSQRPPVEVTGFGWTVKAPFFTFAILLVVGTIIYTIFHRIQR
jgi:chromosome segregation ATPase